MPFLTTMSFRDDWWWKYIVNIVLVNSLKFLPWNLQNCAAIILRLHHVILVLPLCRVVSKYWRQNFGKAKKISLNNLYYDHDKVRKAVSVCISLA